MACLEGHLTNLHSVDSDNTCRVKTELRTVPVVQFKVNNQWAEQIPAICLRRIRMVRQR